MADDMLLDTGPLVALVDRRERHHLACKEIAYGFAGRVFTTEAVVAEAVYMLGRVPGGDLACLQLLIDGFAEIVPTSVYSLRRVRALMTKYADIPMDYADATLVVLAEELGCRDVFTLDRRGFSIYRADRVKPFRIVP